MWWLVIAVILCMLRVNDTCLACAYNSEILTAVVCIKLGQTPLICETEPSEM